MATGHIKIDRKILDWEWYKDFNVFKSFIHLLIKANYKDGNFKNIFIKRGQVLVGRFETAKEIGITEQEFRTVIKKLLLTNEITIKSTNKFSIITICKYDSYQSNKETTNHHSNQQEDCEKKAINSNQQNNHHSNQHSNQQNDYTTNCNIDSYKNNLEIATNKTTITATSTATTSKEDKKIINNIECVSENEISKNKIKFLEDMLVPEMEKIWKQHKTNYPSSIEEDYHALLNIAYHIGTSKGWKQMDVLEIKKENVLAIWNNTAKFICENGDVFLKGLTLDGLAIKKNWQKVILKFQNHLEEIEIKKKQSLSAEIGINNTKPTNTTTQSLMGLELAKKMEKYG